MKVYELMNALAKLPSGAEVICWSTLTVNELENGPVIDDDDENNILYEFVKPLDSVEDADDHVNLCF